MDRGGTSRWLVVVVLVAALVAPLAASAQEAEAVCEPLLIPRLVVGQQASALVGLNVRDEPNGRWIGGILFGSTFSVLDGPRMAPGPTGECLVWWYVHDPLRDQSGWIAEGFDRFWYWTEPLELAAVAVEPAVVAPDDVVVAPDVGEIGFPDLIETRYADVVEWGVWRPDIGYVAVGWTWTTPEGELGCSVPEVGAPLTTSAFCALVKIAFE